MRKILILLLAPALFLLTSCTLLFAESNSIKVNDHTSWIIKSLQEIQTIKAGMTRADLFRVFKEEGGISTRLQRQFVYKDCPYIKVTVKFEPAENPDDMLTENQNDRIIDISKPYLEWTIAD